jgi:hypothetical protein
VGGKHQLATGLVSDSKLPYIHFTQLLKVIWVSSSNLQGPHAKQSHAASHACDVLNRARGYKMAVLKLHKAAVHVRKPSGATASVARKRAAPAWQAGAEGTRVGARARFATSHLWTDEWETDVPEFVLKNHTVRHLGMGQASGVMDRLSTVVCEERRGWVSGTSVCSTHDLGSMP